MVNEEMDKLMSDSYIIFKRIVTVGVTLLIIILFYKYATYQEEIKILKNLNTASEAKLEIYKTKEGLNAGKIQAFEAKSAKDFINLSTKDSTISKLQQLVKSNQKKIIKQGSIAIISTETNADVTVPTKPIDSTIISNDIKYPVYKADFNLKGWIWGSSISSKDSTSYKINYKEELSIVIGKEKTGFLGLGKGVPYGDVTLYNPYSEVKELRVYQTKLPRVKRFGIGPTVNYGFGDGLRSGFSVGVGVSYDVIQF